jgi:ABC-type lipoprotein release transport system permease subunit
MLVPFSYTLRSLFVRRSATLLTVFGVGATVAVLSGVLALRAGFVTLFTGNGRDDVAVFLRPGSPSEGESSFSRENADRIVKTLPEIATGPDQQPLAAMECYLAVRRQKKNGAGETNVPIRGVQPASFKLRDDLKIVEGRNLQFGADEVVVGRKLVDRIANCRVGEVVLLNTTPFRVVGVLACEGPFESEIWGDFERMTIALQRPFVNRIVAHLKPGVDVAALSKRLEDDKEMKAKVLTERAYLATMTGAIGSTLLSLSIGLGFIMGLAAVFTSTNTMLSSVAGRTREIGMLLALGFRPFPIFLSFLIEAVLLGAIGGAVGGLLAMPLNGIQTGTTNFQTFTDVSFAFRVTPAVLVTAIVFSLGLGLIGGAIPAFRAARLAPTEALRRR